MYAMGSQHKSTGPADVGWFAWKAGNQQSNLRVLCGGIKPVD
jgi:hypothetical protein